MLRCLLCTLALAASAQDLRCTDIKTPYQEAGCCDNPNNVLRIGEQSTFSEAVKSVYTAYNDALPKIIPQSTICFQNSRKSSEKSRKSF